MMFEFAFVYCFYDVSAREKLARMAAEAGETIDMPPPKPRTVVPTPVPKIRPPPVPVSQRGMVTPTKSAPQKAPSRAGSETSAPVQVCLYQELMVCCLGCAYSTTDSACLLAYRNVCVLFPMLT